jgi:hypothetical protein
MILVLILICFRTANEPTIYPTTNPMPDVAPHFQLLQASADSESESELCILVDGRFIKYLNVDPGLYDVDDLCFWAFVTLGATPSATRRLE